jgi:hypothetical protein
MEEYKLHAFQDKVFGDIFGPRKNDVSRDWKMLVYVTTNFVNIRKSFDVRKVI